MSVDRKSWRGRAAEEDAERAAAEAPDERAVLRLRARSRRLLAGLLRPHRRLLGVTIALLLLQNAAGMAGPFLVIPIIGGGIAPLAGAADTRAPLWLSTVFLAAELTA